jgi:3',5'-cyclic AMP phosphodiesterase CpdA
VRLKATAGTLSIGAFLAILFATPAAAMTPVGPETAVSSQTALTGTSTLVGAGDIASCTSGADEKTAAIVAGIPGIVFTAGDNVYPDGSSSNYKSCYSPSWGAFKSRTMPVPGNHDYYLNPGAAGYFGYFGGAAGPSGRGYYAYNAGGWRIYALDSELAPSSSAYADEYGWLQNDLAANPNQCVLAIWHRPAFSTGPHGNSARMQKFFQLLYTSGAEIVVNGHDHMYERFVPMDGTGAAHSNGVREFVVGTGGASLYAFKTTNANIAVRNNRSHGVLRLNLSPGGYSWQFIPATGTLTDSGSGSCH